jgi:hypothetical protein
MGKHTRRRLCELATRIFICSMIETPFNQNEFPDFTLVEILTMKKYIAKHRYLFTTSLRNRNLNTPVNKPDIYNEQSSWQQIAVKAMEERS